MYKQLAALYHKLSNFPLVEWVGNRYLDGLPLGNLLAYIRLKKQRTNRNRKSGPIVVVFVQQHKVNWDIVRPLYERMLEDDSFEPYLVSVEEPNDESHDAAHRMLVHLYGSQNVIKAEGGEGKGYFDLRSLSPDYVFLPRPYDQYLPKQYRSAAISSYASVSYIPYSLVFVETTERDEMLGRFFRNVSMFFADTQYSAKIERARHPRSHAEGLRRTIVSGLPYLQSYAKLGDSSPGSLRMLWTPRWGEEAELGGSSFLPFRDQIIQYISKNTDVSLIFRPHPYLFEHFVKTGKMTRDEMLEYYGRYGAGGRLEYDDAPDLRSSFSRSNVLVTDMSAIIVPYLMTGKPIIYCETGAKLNPFGRKLLESMYVANTFEEVAAHLDRIKQGIDPLSELRSRTAKELLSDGCDESSGIIMQALIEDCRGCEVALHDANIPCAR